jgi:hypothetical protein
MKDKRNPSGAKEYGGLVKKRKDGGSSAKVGKIK